MLTPDSSRFWPADQYRPGQGQPSFDKQFVRDYLETLDWNKTPPAPALPPEIVAKTQAKYLEAYERLTGKARLTQTPLATGSAFYPCRPWLKISSSTCGTSAGQAEHTQRTYAALLGQIRGLGGKAGTQRLEHGRVAAPDVLPST